MASFVDFFLDTPVTASATTRRNQRRHNAKTRLAWYLHRKGIAVLSRRLLLKLQSQLRHHHSKDPILLRSIQAAMTSKHPSWRCSNCHVVMKGSFPRCWKLDRSGSLATILHLSHRSIDNNNLTILSRSGQQPPWDGQQWQGSNSGSLSPRSRARRPSDRGRKQNKGNGSWQGGDQQNYPKGQGKGQEHLAPAQVPMPPFMPYPQMMPQYPPMMMQPPLPPPMNDKGAGKGSVSPSMMMPTASMAPPGGRTSTGPTMPRGPNGQMMQFPMPPMGSSSAPACSPNAQNTTNGPAQQQLNRLLKEMMKEEDNLSPHLQSIVHEIQKQGEKSSIKNLSSAVPALGDAKQELLAAESARAQMLSQWKDISPAVRCEIARVHSQLSGVRKRSSAGCASCTICGEAGSAGFRPGLQARTSWQRWTLHHLRQRGQRCSRRGYGRPSWRERPESPRRHELL